MTSRLRYTAMAVLSLGLTGCHLLGGKVKPDPIPAPPAPIPVDIKAPPPKVEPPGPPPKIETNTPEPPTNVATTLPKPPAPKPKKPKKATPSAAATQAPAATTPPQSTSAPSTIDGSTVAPSPIPKLGEILPDDQIIQLQKSCDESITHARTALGQLRGFQMSPEQRQSLERVQTFITQAEQARSRDPQTAKRLAENAELLSRDLVRTVR